MVPWIGPADRDARRSRDWRPGWILHAGATVSALRQAVARWIGSWLQVVFSETQRQSLFSAVLRSVPVPEGVTLILSLAWGRGFYEK